MHSPQSRTSSSRFLTFTVGLAFVICSAGLCQIQRRDTPPNADIASDESHDPHRSIDEIRHRIAQYAESIDKADTELASKVWLNSIEASFIHPLGHEHGFEQIKQNVYGHLMGETFSERKLTPRDIAIHVYGSSAWAEFYWDFNAKFRKDSSPIATHGRETQVYWKTQDGWRLVHVHYSGMPVKQNGF